MRFKYSADYDLWLRLARRGEPVVVDADVARFRMGEGSLSITGFEQQFDEHAQNARENGEGHRVAVAVNQVMSRLIVADLPIDHALAASFARVDGRDCKRLYAPIVQCQRYVIYGLRLANERRCTAADPDFFAGRRVVVTGGAGFLGSHVCERLDAAGRGGRSCRAPSEYDLTNEEAVSRSLRRRSARARHPSRRARRRHRRQPRQPRRLLVRQPDDGRVDDRARVVATASTKFVQLGTICSYPKFTPIPFQEDNLWDGYPEETNAPYGIAKKALLAGSPGLPRAVRHRRRLSDAGQPLRTARQLRSRELARDSGADPQDDRGRANSGDRVMLWGDGSASREFLYVDDCARAILLADRALRRR